jgi:hypothetical protein
MGLLSLLAEKILYSAFNLVMSAAESSGEEASIFVCTLKLSVLRVLMMTFWCCNKTNVLHGIGSDSPPRSPLWHATPPTSTQSMKQSFEERLSSMMK